MLTAEWGNFITWSEIPSTSAPIISAGLAGKNALLKGTQNALNMMMGQIVSEIDRFSKIPAHQMDEGKIQTHKSNIIHITIQAEQDIRQILLSFEGN